MVISCKLGRFWILAKKMRFLDIIVKRGKGARGNSLREDCFYRKSEYQTQKLHFFFQRINFIALEMEKG